MLPVGNWVSWLLLGSRSGGWYLELPLDALGVDCLEFLEGESAGELLQVLLAM